MNEFSNKEAIRKDYQSPAGCSTWVRESYEIGRNINFKEINEIQRNYQMNFNEYVFECVEQYLFINMNSYEANLKKINFQIGNEFLKSAIFYEFIKSVSNQIGDASLFNKMKPLIISYCEAWAVNAS